MADDYQYINTVDNINIQDRLYFVDQDRCFFLIHPLFYSSSEKGFTNTHETINLQTPLN